MFYDICFSDGEWYYTVIYLSAIMLMNPTCYGAMANCWCQFI